MSTVSFMERVKAKKILSHQFEHFGRSRKWLAEQIGTTTFYISIAMTMQPRADRGDKYLCPDAVIHKILAWGKENEKQSTLG